MPHQSADWLAMTDLGVARQNKSYIENDFLEQGKKPSTEGSVLGFFDQIKRLVAADSFRGVCDPASNFATENEAKIAGILDVFQGIAVQFQRTDCTVGIFVRSFKSRRKSCRISEDF